MIAKKTDPAVTIRFPRDLLVAATRAARANGRSRNTEIVLRLSRSLGVARHRK